MADSILECSQAVCAASSQLRDAIGDANQELVDLVDQLEAYSAKLVQDIQNSGGALKCVVNGPDDSYCDLPLAGTLPTLAEAISNVNAVSVTDVDGEAFTATEGQTTFSLTLPPALPPLLEVSLNGAVDSLDYTVVGSSLTFADPLAEGDSVTTRRFTI